jgi:hypothetical protein
MSDLDRAILERYRYELGAAVYGSSTTEFDSDA